MILGMDAYQENTYMVDIKSVRELLKKCHAFVVTDSNDEGRPFAKEIAQFIQEMDVFTE